MQPTAKKVTDAATRYDGMFCHHICLWLFALVRANHIDDGIRIAKSIFSSFFSGPVGGRTRGGMRYKVSVDGTPSALDKYGTSEDGNSYDDTMNAYVVYQMLEHRNQHRDVISLQNEINQMQTFLRGYEGVDDEPWRQPRLRGEHDPMWWGIEVRGMAY